MLLFVRVLLFVLKRWFLIVVLSSKLVGLLYLNTVFEVEILLSDEFALASVLFELLKFLLKPRVVFVAIRGALLLANWREFNILYELLLEVFL